MTTSDLDAIFNGADMALGTARTAANVFMNGYNDIKNAFSSRRNFQPNNYYGGMYGGYGYSQPVPYGYGYADYSYYPNCSMYPSGSYNMGFGGTPNGYYNNGYFGFSDPTYGSGGQQQMPAPNGYDGFYNSNGPKGGAWLL
jgi:hypothetical protein